MKSVGIILGLFIHFVAGYEVETISSDRWLQSYSAYWDTHSQSLLFVDYLSEKRAINRYSMIDDKVYSASVEAIQPISFILPLEKYGDRYAVGDGLSVQKIHWDGKESSAKIVKELLNVEKEENHASNFWSITKISPNCELVGGTLRGSFCGPRGDGSGGKNGSVYQFSKCCGLTRLLDDQGLSAGLDWNPIKNLFYHIDTCNYDLREYEWDPRTGKIYRGHIVYDFRIDGKLPGYHPVDLTLDTKGNVYVALYGKGAVWKINPKTSKVIKKIHLPAKVISSVAFGGKNLDILFVTSGRREYDFRSGTLTDKKYYGKSGAVFMVKGLGAEGFEKKRLCKV